MKEETYHIDDLDGAVTLFKSTDEGTETIAVFDEEHREIIDYLAKKANRFYKFWDMSKRTHVVYYRLDLALEYIMGLDSNGEFHDYNEWLKSIGEELIE